MTLFKQPAVCVYSVCTLRTLLLEYNIEGWPMIRKSTVVYSGEASFCDRVHWYSAQAKVVEKVLLLYTKEVVC